jgi:HPt (histidine-containing phosphotransfer) domain-containing protein
MERVQQCLQDGDAATAERHAHTLKGLAGSLGAAPLQQAAGALESALREHTGAGPIDAALAPAAEQLAALLQLLQGTPGLLEQAPVIAAHSVSDTDRAATAHMLQTIRDLLQQDDAQAAELWEANAPLLRALCPDAGRIEAAIAGFAFDEALALMPPGA